MLFAITLHLLAAIVWIGGMFFAYLIVRPAASALDAANRLPLWGRIFNRFFFWVWFAVALLLVSGYWMIFNVWGGFAGAPVYLHIMHGLGWLMVLLFLHLWFAPYRRFRQALAVADYPVAAKYLGSIRLFVAINLTLGLINAVVGVSGKYW